MRTIPREVCQKRKDAFSLSNKQKSVLVGTLLGDGGLRFRGLNCRLHIKHSANQVELVRYKHQVFSNITSMPVRIFDQKVGTKNYSFAEFVTLTHPSFTLYYDLFYPNDKKIIPSNIGELLINPLSLAIWIMDDGSAEYAGISLQTHCFTKREVGTLIKVIKHNFNLDTNMRLNRGKWIIYFPKHQMDNLRKVVEAFMLPQFLYKLTPYHEKTNPVETVRRNPP